jgi:hypothetical protein
MRHRQRGTPNRYRYRRYIVRPLPPPKEGGLDVQVVFIFEVDDRLRERLHGATVGSLGKASIQIPSSKSSHDLYVWVHILDILDLVYNVMAGRRKGAGFGGTLIGPLWFRTGREIHSGES